MLYGITGYGSLTMLTKRPRLINFPSMKVLTSLFGGEVIEDYPEDKPYPCCLVYGETRSRQPVHSVWAYNPENKWAVLITVYRPDPKRWIDGRKRRPKDDSV